MNSLFKRNGKWSPQTKKKKIKSSLNIDQSVKASDNNLESQYLIEKHSQYRNHARAKHGTSSSGRADMIEI